MVEEAQSLLSLAPARGKRKTTSFSCVNGEEGTSIAANGSVYTSRQKEGDPRMSTSGRRKSALTPYFRTLIELSPAFMPSFKLKPGNKILSLFLPLPLAFSLLTAASMTVSGPATRILALVKVASRRLSKHDKSRNASVEVKLIRWEI